MYVLADRDFITLNYFFEAEYNNRHLLSYRSALADAACGNNNVAELTSQVACKLNVTRKKMPTSHMTSHRRRATLD